MMEHDERYAHLSEFIPKVLEAITRRLADDFECPVACLLQVMHGNPEQVFTAGNMPREVAIELCRQYAENMGKSDEPHH